MRSWRTSDGRPGPESIPGEDVGHMGDVACNLAAACVLVANMWAQQKKLSHEFSSHVKKSFRVVMLQG